MGNGLIDAIACPSLFFAEILGVKSVYGRATGKSTMKLLLH